MDLWDYGANYGVHLTLLITNLEFASLVSPLGGSQ